MKTKQLTATALLAAAALILSYVESFIPLGLPGVKLGLANAVILLTLYTQGMGRSAAVSVIRLGGNAIFAGVSVLPYSAAGAALSLGAMYLAKRLKLNVIAVSVLGAAAHSIGQVCVAVAVLGTPMLFLTYLPLIGLLSVICGVLTGISCHAALRIISKH